MQRLREHAAAFRRPAGEQRLDERLESGHGEAERPLAGDRRGRPHDDVAHMVHEHGEPSGRGCRCGHRRRSRHAERHGDRGPRHRTDVEAGENELHHAWVFLGEAVEFVADKRAIVLRHQRQTRMAALEVGIPSRAIAIHEPGPEHRGQPRIASAGVVEPFDEVAEGSLEGCQFDRREILASLRLTADKPHLSRRPTHALARHAIDLADGEVEARPPRLEPLPDLVPDDFAGRDGQFHPHAGLVGQQASGLPPLFRARLKGVEPAAGTGLGIEHDTEGPLHRLQLDRIEVAVGQTDGEVDCSTIGREFGQGMKLDPPRLGRAKVVGHGIDRQRRHARLRGEGRQPAADAIALPRPVDHVEDDDHGLARGRRGGEEIPHRRVVVFLLGEHRHDHVAGVAHQFGAVPIFAQCAVDVGSVEEHEPRGLPAARVLTPHEPVGVAAGIGPEVDRILHALPWRNREAGKECRQVGAGGKPLRQAGHRMPGPRRLRHGAADLRGHERVGDQALAGVGAAADGRHKHGLPRHLRPELAEKRAIPLVGLRIGGPERACQRLQGVDQAAQLFNAAGPRRKPRPRERCHLATLWMKNV